MPSYYGVVATVVAASVFVAPAEAQNIYTGPDLNVLYPVEGTAIFVAVVLSAAVVEYVIDVLMAIENDYFQKVYSSVREETIVCSILTMLMIFAKSVGTLQPKWVLMLNYAVLGLFFMVLFFVVIIGGSVMSLRLEVSKWRRFEGTRIDADPMLSYKEIIFKACRDRFRESLALHDVKSSNDVMFTDYMQRMQRFTVAAITDLSWKSWLALAVMVIINGVRSRITTGSQTGVARLSRADRTINVSTYIGVVGYGTLLIYMVVHFMLQMRLRSFAQASITSKDADGNVEVSSSQARLFFSRFATTSHIFQCTVLVLEWYLSVFALGMAYEISQEYGYLAILIFASAVLPMFIFVWMFPWTITMITILNGLGADLDVEEAEATVQAATLEEEQAKNTTGVADAQAEQEALARGAADEWQGEYISLHETAGDKMLDVYSPSLNVRADHPNAPKRKAFEAKPARPVFSESMVLVPPDGGRVPDPFAGDTMGSRPLPRRDSRPQTGMWHNSSITRPGPHAEL